MMFQTPRPHTAAALKRSVGTTTSISTPKRSREASRRGCDVITPHLSRRPSPLISRDPPFPSPRVAPSRATPVRRSALLPSPSISRYPCSLPPALPLASPLARKTVSIRHKPYPPLASQIAAPSAPLTVALLRISLRKKLPLRPARTRRYMLAAPPREGRHSPRRRRLTGSSPSRGRPVPASRPHSWRPRSATVSPGALSQGRFVVPVAHQEKPPPP